jgi:limonene-1,2-epoxide hydrolase
MDADRIVTEFCQAWGRADLDHIMGTFADDAVYHNIPMAPCTGKAEIEGFIKGFLAGSPGGIEFDVKHQAVLGNVVLNERIDTLTMEGKTVSLPVCGVFEVDAEGKISAWRDYFDMGAFQGD